MKKFIGLILIQVVILGSVFGQNSFKKLYTINNMDIEVDPNDCVVSTYDGGYAFVASPKDYDGTGQSFGLFVKIDDKGNIQWSKRCESFNYNPEFNEILQTNDGGYLIAGYESGVSHVLKFDNNGNLLWWKEYQWNDRWNLLELNDGSIILSSRGYSNKIIKLDPFGNEIWANEITTPYVYLLGMNHTIDNHLVISGRYLSSISPALNSSFVSKLDYSGNVIWSNFYTYTSNITFETITPLSDSGFVATGSYGFNDLIVKLNEYGDTIKAINSNIDQNNSPIENNNGELFFVSSESFATVIYKTDSALNLEWSKEILTIDPLASPQNINLAVPHQTNNDGFIVSSRQYSDFGWRGFGLYKFDENVEICFSNFPNYSLSFNNISISPSPFTITFSPFNTNPITQAWNIINIYVDVKEPSAITPDLCLISVDSTSTQNKVVWEKPITQAIDSFMVYREFGTGNYGVVGSVPYDSLSQFYDNTVGVNPNITSYRYKISAVDTCGNESQLSDFHETMHLSTNLAPNGDINLIWDAYEGFPVTYYRILRDSTFSNNWEVLDSVSNNVFIWTDINPPTNGADYVIDVIAPFGCTSTKAQDHNSTRSNRANILGGGVSPGANFTANFTQINIGGTLDFLDQSINNPTSWTWQFPGGSPAFSTQQNPSGITYNTVGLYDVTLIVSNANGLDTLVKTNYIEVLAGSGGSAPACDFLASATQVPEGTPVDFLDLTLNSPTSWTWLFPGGNPAFSTDQSPIDIYYNTAGTYDVTLITSNGNGTDTLVKTNYIEVVSTIGVQEYKEGQVRVYPNPANDRLTVELTQIELPCFFALKDMQGRTVYNTVVNAEKLEIDLSTYAKGIYLIRVNNDNFSRELKLVKQ